MKIEHLTHGWIQVSVHLFHVTKFGKDKKMFDYAYPTAIRPDRQKTSFALGFITMLVCAGRQARYLGTKLLIMGYGVDVKKAEKR